MSPVAPPISQPLSFRFPPERNPPPKSPIKERAVMMYCKLTSRADVNRRMVAKIKLLSAENKKIKIKPYKIDIPKLFDSIILSPF
jgi:hypothetical protein